MTRRNWLPVAIVWMAIYPVASMAAFTFEDLRELITKKKLNTIEAVIPNLPPEYLINYTLVAKSASLQEAEEENPRVLLYGIDASLVLAFNGREGLTGFNSLELYQYRPKTHSYEFRKIEFGGMTPEFSEANPVSCLSCHHADPGPFWSNYSDWPETYLVNTNATSNISAEKFKRIRKSWANHPRYKHLVLSSESILASGNTSNRNASSGSGTNRTDGPPWIMGYLMGDWNSDRITDRIMKSPLFAAHRETFVAYFARCNEFPAAAFSKRIEQVFEKVYPRRSHEELYAERPNLNTGMDPEPRMAFMLEKVLTGLDVYRWDHKLQPGANTDGSVVPSQRGFMGHSSIDEMIGARVANASGAFGTITATETYFGTGDAILSQFIYLRGNDASLLKCQKLVRAASDDLAAGW